MQILAIESRPVGMEVIRIEGYREGSDGIYSVIQTVMFMMS